MTLTKSEIIDNLCDEYILSRKDAKGLVDDIFERVRESLEDGDGVKITNLGNFDIRNKSSRPGRNPKTGEIIPVSARRVVTFKAGQNLKAAIAANIETLLAQDSSAEASKDVV
ncbi:MAG: integration host factor subunit alpha [Francisellaceae bacterium]|jgi:integration host factor subunit alpha|nr:integration host factor subunit alpha [Francisellaceae bacterium]MBT6208143.1 integration host factor subunit alpha [Francisellaceae bacterium]MBT6538287.1 integration host factor subunit alpha [Francisellaceae bacterium]